jgi:hypothetical protein
LLDSGLKIFFFNLTRIVTQKILENRNKNKSSDFETKKKNRKKKLRGIWSAL